MKFDHMIKLNGIYYAAGEDVPMEEKNDAPEIDVPMEEKIEIPELQVDDEPKRRGKKPKAV
jgi:hypothetical protein|nr:MAG TPA_asm: hypothetical protein [Bacteriophage sp.]DAV45844.1 MAG TPA: hypothetical protein [Bacteriophage sp.]